MKFLNSIDLGKIFNREFLQGFLKIAVIILIGLVIIRIFSLIVMRIAKRKVSPQVRMLVKKGINYGGFIMLVLIVLNEYGVALTPLLGAAGIIGIALGIASQTSLSNIISGIFLVSEKPFTVGDVIRLNDKTGIIQSIDLLSVKIRTFDNQYIRIPSEKILNGELTNVTRYPIRRLDFTLVIDLKEDPERVRNLLVRLAAKNRFCLNEPEPLIVFNRFGEAGIEILFAVWFVKTDYLQTKNSVFLDIKSLFEAEGIEFAYPRRTIRIAAGEPIPLRCLNPVEYTKE